jgi:ATP-dependent Clp protease ATP-binding subunit ClpA
MNNFTPRAQQVLALARKEADRFNHNYVGTEHLLLGLIKLGQGVAVNVLQKMNLDLETDTGIDLADNITKETDLTFSGEESVNGTLVKIDVDGVGTQGKRR